MQRGGERARARLLPSPSRSPPPPPSGGAQHAPVLPSRRVFLPSSQIRRSPPLPTAAARVSSASNTGRCGSGRPWRRRVEAPDPGTGQRGGLPPIGSCRPCPSRGGGGAHQGPLLHPPRSTAGCSSIGFNSGLIPYS